MAQNQSDWNSMFQSPQAETLLKNKQAVESLMKSQEAQQLMELLNKNSGQGLQQAAESAMKGNTAQLTQLVEGLMRNPQSAKLVEELNKKVNL